jgi:pyrroloquinoline quinone biosynthesis protein D
MATMITQERPCTRVEVSAAPLDDELVLYDPNTLEAFVLNPTAARIWALCDGSRTVAAIAKDLSKLYGLGRQQALEDVCEFIDDMRRAGLLA